MAPDPSIAEAEFIQALRGSVGTLSPGPQVMAREQVADIHRRRIIAGMAESMAEHGYTNTTVTDVVRAARVSRRTFYEHFADKRECMLATYDVTSDLLLQLVEQAFAAPGTWQERMQAGLRAYIEIMASLPRLSRVSVIEVPAAGPDGLERVRLAHRRFADMVRRVAEQHAEELPAGWGLDDLTATALIGAVNELTIQRLAADESLTDEAITRTIMHIGLALLSANPLDELE